MVCVPCFIIPVLLYIWHKFVQPLLLRYWNPWQKKDAQGNVVKAGPEFPFECKGGVCPYQGAKKQKAENDEGGAKDKVELKACSASQKCVNHTEPSELKTIPALTDLSNQTKKTE